MAHRHEYRADLRSALRVGVAKQAGRDNLGWISSCAIQLHCGER